MHQPFLGGGRHEVRQGPEVPKSFGLRASLGESYALDILGHHVGKENLIELRNLAFLNVVVALPRGFVFESSIGGFRIALN